MVLWIILILLLVLAGGACFMIAPGKRRDTRRFEGKAFAHRGLFDNEHGVPENSLAAFRRARAHGFGVELDVQLTKDGQVVVFHDDTLERVCGNEGTIGSYTYQELQRFRLYRTRERIPLFSEVLKELGGMPVICEIKVAAGTDYQALCEKAAPLIDSYRGDICIESFNPKAVGWFRKNRPEMIRGQLTMNFMKDPGGLPFPIRLAMSHCLVNVIGRPDFIAYGVDWGETLGFMICRSFHPMLAAWTITSQEQQETVRKRYHSVIFDHYIAQ